MSQLINNEQKLIDIIFADRNKEYGAYAIRSSYGNTVFRSISYMILGVGSIMSTAFYFSNKNNPEQSNNDLIVVHDSIYVIPVTLHKEEPAGDPETVEPPKAKENPDVSESTSTVVRDSVPESTITTTVAAAPMGTVTEGADAGSIAAKGSASVTGLGTGVPDTTTKVNEPYEVDTEPQFEGGLSALYRFVSKNLKYPNWASSEGKEGIVYVKFVVDENGKVGSLNLLNTVGYGMDAEALRVVSLIPKFKSPAKAKGKAVKVYYQMPIRFSFKY